LDPSGETAWIRHAAGAARLIQLRGPKNYTTEFEKALLMAHTGPIVRFCPVHFCQKISMSNKVPDD